MLFSVVWKILKIGKKKIDLRLPTTDYINHRILGDYSYNTLFFEELYILGN